METSNLFAFEFSNSSSMIHLNSNSFFERLPFPLDQPWQLKLAKVLLLLAVVSDDARKRQNTETVSYQDNYNICNGLINF